EKSGFKYQIAPSNAPGNVNENIAKTVSNIINVVITRREKRSVPPLIPLLTLYPIINAAIREQIMTSHGLETILTKTAEIPAVDLPEKEPEANLPNQSSIHPLIIKY